MPTITRTKTKTKEATRAANGDHADKLFKKGQCIVAGEKPTTVFPKEKPAAAPLLCPTVERIAAAVSDLLTLAVNPMTWAASFSLQSPMNTGRNHMQAITIAKR
jgi:hypothetical protein